MECMKRGVISKLLIKVAQSEGSPGCIARGVALGLATGLIFPIGFQTFIVLFLAFLFRANKVLSWTFTCITNPASVWFIYPVQCYIGSYLLFNPLNFHTLSEQFKSLLRTEDGTEMLKQFINIGNEIVCSFFAGGILFALLIAPAGYIISFRLAQYYQQRKQAKKANLKNKKEKSEF